MKGGVAIPYFVALTTYISYGLLFIFGHMRDFFRHFSKKQETPKVRSSCPMDPSLRRVLTSTSSCLMSEPFVIAMNLGRVTHLSAETLKISTQEGYTIGYRCSLWNSDPPEIRFEDAAVSKNLWELMRCGWQDCFNRPIASAPNSWVDVIERVSTDHNKTLL